MEEYGKSPLEREDRENDIDEFVIEGGPLNGMDYGTYLKMLDKKNIGDINESAGDEPDASEVEVKAQRKKSGSGSTGSVEIIDSRKRLVVALKLNEQMKCLMRFAAAKESKSVGEYVSDLVIKDLRKKRKEIEAFITAGLGKSSVD